MEEDREGRGEKKKKDRGKGKRRVSKGIKQEREQREESARLAFLNIFYHCQIPSALSLVFFSFLFFSLSLLAASFLAVTDASSLLFVLAFFNVLFLGFVSGQCLCPGEFPLRTCIFATPILACSFV